MTYLKCNVTDCLSNKNHLCCRPDIKVSGKEADSPDQTCCDSFQNKSQGMQNRSDYSYDYDYPNEALQVSCSARKCTYNESGICYAESIHIGNQSSSTTRETECCTFREE